MSRTLPRRFLKCSRSQLPRPTAAGACRDSLADVDVLRGCLPVAGKYLAPSVEPAGLFVSQAYGAAMALLHDINLVTAAAMAVGFVIVASLMLLAIEQ